MVTSENIGVTFILLAGNSPRVDSICGCVRVTYANMFAHFIREGSQMVGVQCRHFDAFTIVKHCSYSPMVAFKRIKRWSGLLML